MAYIAKPLAQRRPYSSCLFSTATSPYMSLVETSKAAAARSGGRATILVQYARLRRQIHNQSKLYKRGAMGKQAINHQKGVTACANELIKIS